MIPLSVIVVTHNHGAYIDRCLNTLVPEITRINGELIVIDNRSDDESAAIARSYPQVKLHINKQRRGFAANNNFGMAIAKGHYILILNPDTEVLPHALEKLINFMDTHPKVGLCGAQLLFPDGAIQPSARRFPSITSVIARRTPLRGLLRNSRFNQHHLMLDVDHSQPREVDWLLGACLFIRREILAEVGPLDEGFFLYVEDIDWARRIHQAGWQVYYVPDAQIIHHHLAVSDKKFFSRYMWIHFWSMMRYTRKHLLPAIPWLAIDRSQLDVWNLTSKQNYQPLVVAKSIQQQSFWKGYQRDRSNIKPNQ